MPKPNWRATTRASEFWVGEASSGRTCPETVLGGAISDHAKRDIYPWFRNVGIDQDSMFVAFLASRPHDNKAAVSEFGFVAFTRIINSPQDEGAFCAETQ